jgi:rod shape-determining protein MreC
VRNIFLFIRRYFTFLFFIVLEFFCIYLLFTYNSFHHTLFMDTANEYTGKVFKRYNAVEYYFHLKATNDSLVKANARLYNKLRNDFEIPDTATVSYVDSLNVDSLNRYRKYLFMEAKVVGNSVTLPNNYLQLSRGRLQGVEKELGVIDINNNVVGTVIDVSDNYAVVMSMLHKQSSLSARLKKTGESGYVAWDGIEPNIVSLRGISKGVKMTVGDSVVTSGFTDRFPYGMLIGRIASIELGKENTYKVNVRTAANFYNIEHVFVINNLRKDELKEMMKNVKKLNE